jgi:hypothetical protein
VLTGHGAVIGTTTPSGKLVFGIFAAFAEFEQKLISERTRAGLESACAYGRKGGTLFKMTTAKMRLVMATMGQPETNVGAMCKEPGITMQTRYRQVAPDGSLQENEKGSLNREERDQNRSNTGIFHCSRYNQLRTINTVTECYIGGALSVILKSLNE